MIELKQVGRSDPKCGQGGRGLDAKLMHSRTHALRTSSLLAASQRTHEIGVRRAMGAGNDGILRMVLGQGGTPLAIGLALGALLALGFGQLLARFLFEVEGFDPVTFGVVTFVLATVSLVAGWVPALRALRVVPIVALRQD